MQDRGKTALITGGSAGIGYAFAKLFARDGYNLILVARDAQRLQDVAAELQQRFGVSVTVVPNDLSHPTAPQELFAQLQRDSVKVDVLVNNAGFGLHGSFASMDLGAQLEMIQLNVTALTHLTRLFLPEMLKRGAGKILNVASTAAYQPGPLMAVYYATKAYVLSFSEALANEVRGSGVSVTALCPGPTRTEFQQHADIGDIPLMRWRIMEADAVARIGYRGLVRNKTVVIPGFLNQALRVAVARLPRTVVAHLVRTVHEKRRDTHPQERALNSVRVRG